jgi:hypothetical protein
MAPLIGAHRQHAVLGGFFKVLIAFKTSRMAQAVLTAEAVDAAGDAVG